MRNGDGSHPLGRVRQPEYTGDNRCIPCTVTNLVIAVAVSAAVGYGVFTAGRSGRVAVGVGAVTFLAGSLSIYLRGYLVPGTPKLTKQYFPAWLLARFGKQPSQSSTPPDAVDVEATLLEADVLEPKPDGDLGLTSSFAAVLDEQFAIERANDAGRDTLASVVGADATELWFETVGEDVIMAYHDDRKIGQWESHAAFLADAGAGKLLADRLDDWDALSPGARGQLLAGLRLFLERCPACDGVVQFGGDVVESCCTTHDVVAVTCQDCGDRLFEMEADPAAADVAG